MANWTFGLNNENWGTASFSWNFGAMFAGTVAAPQSSITGLSEVVTAGNNFSLNIRYVQVDPILQPVDFVGAIRVNGVDHFVLTHTFTPASATDDSGFINVAGTIPASGTLSMVAVEFTNDFIDLYPTFNAYFDSVYVDENPPGLTARRYLGMGFDNANLYLSSIEGGTLTLEYFAATDLLTALNTFTFGTAAYTDPDTYTKAIYPAVVGDLELYVYGRDGSAVQVQYNDINGTAGWVDAGPGTATWGTAKYCVALMPQPFAPRNLIAAFADDDIYHTVMGLDGGWEKMGDAGTALRTAGRVTTTFNQILVAGQGTAQMYYSQNYGVSFTNALSGLAGTVNAIEVSR